MTIKRFEIIQIIGELLAEQASRGLSEKAITGETLLVKDLGLSSVEFVIIFERLQRKSGNVINFIDLIMPDRSSYIEDLSINQIANFLLKNRNNQPRTTNLDDPYINQRAPITQHDIDLLDQAIRHQTYHDETIELRTQLCFLLSAPRSGSTLLRRMLGCHDEIYAPMELHLMGYQNFSQRQQELQTSEHSHLLEGTVVARQEIRKMRPAVSQAVEEMYSRDKRPVTQFYREIDDHLNQDVWIDKTPSYAFSRSTLERIKSTFPQAKFIHLTRTPNAVIKSMIDSELGQLMRFQQTSGIQSDCFAEALWCLCERNILDALSTQKTKSIHIHFEELVSKPEKVMHQLHSFLGVKPSMAINPYKTTGTFTEEKIGCYAGDLKTFLRSSIDPSVTREWEKFDSLKWLSEPTKQIEKAY